MLTAMFARNIVAARVAVLRAVAMVTVTLAAAGCTEGIAVTDLQDGRARLAIDAYLATPVQSAAPINRIRVTVRVQPENRLVFGPEVFDVNPNQTSWDLPIEFPLTEPTEVSVLIELINFENGVETVEYSNLAMLSVRPGLQPTQSAPLPVYPGGPENLGITSLVIAPESPTVVEGSNVALSASVQGASNPQIFWRSLDEGVATVSESGSVLGVLPGQARIEASAGPRKDTVTVTVTRRMDRLEFVGPSAITLTAIGQRADFQARVVDPRGQPFENAAIMWSVANPDLVDVVGPGSFVGKATGETTVTASATGLTPITGTLRIEQQIAAVEISPTEASVDAIGATSTFTATVKDANGNAVTSPAITWTSSDQAVATVDGNGVATALSVGQTKIRATLGALFAEATFTVGQTATSIVVTPTDVSLTAIGDTARITAEARDRNGRVVPNQTFQFISTNSAVVDVDATGQLRAITSGTAAVQVKLGRLTTTVTVTVQQQVAKVTLGVDSLTFATTGQTAQLDAVARDRNNHPVAGSSVSFGSADMAIATVSPTGLVTATGVGRTTITASADGASVTIPVEVKAAGQGGPPVSLTLDRDSARLQISQTVQLTAVFHDAAGNVVPAPGPITWQSTNTAVATVDQNGLITALANGSTDVVATSGNLTDFATINVGTLTIPTGGADVAVYNDINVFDNGAMGDPNNLVMMDNLVRFSSVGPRSTQTGVIFDNGRSSACGGSCSPNGSFSTMRARIMSHGYTITDITSDPVNAPLTNIAPTVKIIFLWTPQVAFTKSEVNALKAFAAEGGRIVFIGEHSGFYGGGIPIQNQFLIDMGAVMRNVGQAIDCGYVTLPGARLRPHQITTGMTGVTIACASVIQLGPEDYALFYDTSNTLVLAGVAKISTVPLPRHANEIRISPRAAQRALSGQRKSNDPLYPTQGK